MALVLKDDFKGEYKISTGRFNGTELEDAIEKYSKHYLLLLFGKEFYDLFIADLNNATPQVPVTQRFLDVYNAFFIDDVSCHYSSEGIRQMLVKFIYFHFVRDQHNFNTAVGVVRNDNENAVNAGYLGYNLVEAYNSAIYDYKSIQWFMLRSNDYEEVITTRQEEISGY